MRAHTVWGTAIGAVLAASSCPLPAHAQQAGGKPAAAQSAATPSAAAQQSAGQPTGAQPANAQPVATTAPATTLSDLKTEGAVAAAAKQYDTCVRAYSAALAVEPAYATAGELGLCEMALRRFVAAHDHLLYALDGEWPDRTGRSQGTWKIYRNALENVRDRVARVIVTVQPSAAEVFLDGVSLGTSMSGRYIAVMPGTHTWTARLEGYQDDTIVQHGRGGDLPNVDLLLTRPPAPKPAPAPKPNPTPPLVLAPALEPPCVGAQGVRMSPEICRLFEELYRRRMEPTLLFIAGGLMSAGFTADVGPGFWLGGEARWRDKEDWGFSLGAEVRTLLPTKGGIRTNGKPMDISLVTLGIAPCARYKWVSGCAVVDAGISIAGGPPPLSFPKSPILFMLGIGPRLAVDIPIVERVGVRAFADLRFAPQPETGYSNEGVVTWLNPPASGFFGIGVWFK